MGTEKNTSLGRKFQAFITAVPHGLLEWACGLRASNGECEKFD